MKKQNVRTISLIVCIFTFLLVGAAIFDALESDYEAEDLRRLMTIKTHFLTKYNMTHEDFRNMSVLVKQLIPHNARQWKFAGAFYYSVTVMTTIGYGHSTPRTLGGKAFTMFYAFIGIPLGLVMFQSIGERLNVFATFLLANVKKCFRFKNAEVSQTNLIVIDFTLAMMVVFISAAVFDHYENWGYWNAVYYCIITLTTVGFGDLVPLQSGESDLERRPEYVVFTLMFILFGLTVLSANMNLMVLRFMTVNTEDERRDEMEAAVAALTAVKVDGDVIYGGGGGGPSDGSSPRKSPNPLLMSKHQPPAPPPSLAGGNTVTLNGTLPKPKSGASNRWTKAVAVVNSHNKTADSHQVPSGVITADGDSNDGTAAGDKKPLLAGHNEAKLDKSSSVAVKTDEKQSINEQTQSKDVKLKRDDKKKTEEAAISTKKDEQALPSQSSMSPSSSADVGAFGGRRSSLAAALNLVSSPTPPPLLPQLSQPKTVGSTRPLPSTPSSESSSAINFTTTTTTAAAAANNEAKCDPANGQCSAVPKCRHLAYCREGKPADACGCKCHHDKTWRLFVLRANSEAKNDRLSPPPPPPQPRPAPESSSESAKAPPHHHLYQQLASTTPTTATATKAASSHHRSPNIHLNNATLLLKQQRNSVDHDVPVDSEERLPMLKQNVEEDNGPSASAVDCSIKSVAPTISSKRSSTSARHRHPHHQRPTSPNDDSLLRNDEKAAAAAPRRILTTDHVKI